MHKTKVAVVLADPLGQHRLQPGQLRGRRREHQGRSTRPGATRTSSSRTRSSTSTSRTRRRSPKKIKRRVRHHDPGRRGRQVLHERDHGRARAAERPADRRRASPTVFPPKQLLKQFYELAPGSVLNRDRLVEGLAADRDDVQVAGYIYWFAEPGLQGGRETTGSTSRSRSSRATSSTSAASRSRATRRRATRSSAASSRLDEGDVMDMEAVKKSIQKIQQLGYFKIDRGAAVRRARRRRRRSTSSSRGRRPRRNEIQFGAGYSGVRRLLRAVLLPDAQLPRARRDHRRLGAARARSRTSSTSPTRFPGSWTGTSRSASRSSGATSTTSRRTSSARAARVFYAQGNRRSSTRPRCCTPTRTSRRTSRSARAPTPPGPAGAAAEVHRDDGNDLVADAGLPLRQPQRSVRPDAGLPALSAAVQMAPAVPRRRRATSSSRSVGVDDLPPGAPARGARSSPLNLEVGYVAAVRRASRSRSSSASSSAASRACAASSRARSCRVDPETYEVFTDAFGRILGGNKFFVLNLEYQFLHDRARRSCWPSSTSATTTSTRRAFGLGEHPGLGRRGAADLPADLPGAPAVHLRLQPAPDQPGRPVRLPDRLPGGEAVGVHVLDRPDVLKRRSTRRRERGSRRGSRPGLRDPGAATADGPVGRNGPFWAPVVRAVVFATLPRFREDEKEWE